ncbi:hypothetical protein ACLOJK_032489 [Asimina triloba]
MIVIGVLDIASVVICEGGVTGCGPTMDGADNIQRMGVGWLDVMVGGGGGGVASTWEQEEEPPFEPKRRFH